MTQEHAPFHSFRENAGVDKKKRENAGELN